jgi:hypothetical protein
VGAVAGVIQQFNNQQPINQQPKNDQQSNNPTIQQFSNSAIKQFKIHAPPLIQADLEPQAGQLAAHH